MSQAAIAAKTAYILRLAVPERARIARPAGSRVQG